MGTISRIKSFVRLVIYYFARSSYGISHRSISTLRKFNDGACQRQNLCSSRCTEYGIGTAQRHD